jgi:hypothetical protein
MKSLVCFVALCAAACGDNLSYVQIDSPTAGSLVNETQPLVIGLSGSGFQGASAAVSIDGTVVSGTTNTLGAMCDPCAFTITIPDTGVTPASHEVRIEIDVQLSEIAEASIKLMFVSP